MATPLSPHAEMALQTLTKKFPHLKNYFALLDERCINYAITLLKRMKDVRGISYGNCSDILTITLGRGDDTYTLEFRVADRLKSVVDKDFKYQLI